MDAGRASKTDPSQASSSVPPHPITTVSVAPAIAVWHVVISGFTQHRGDPTGSQRLWLKLRGLVNNGRSCVEFFPWNSNWRDVAEWIWRCRPEERPPRVYVYAYSWGAGGGFVRLARALRKRGIEIEFAVLSDPVYCPPLRCLAWLALVPWIPIRVPDNVRRVHYFLQRLNFPRGHKLVADDARRTTIERPQEARQVHHYMDTLFAWQYLCSDVAAAAQPAAAYQTTLEKTPAGAERKAAGTP